MVSLPSGTGARAGGTDDEVGVLLPLALPLALALAWALVFLACGGTDEGTIEVEAEVEEVDLGPAVVESKVVMEASSLTDADVDSGGDKGVIRLGNKRG